MDKIDFFDYYNCNNNIIENGDKIEILNKFKGAYEVELIECKIKSKQLNIDNELYTYIEKDDVFMSLNYDTYNEFVKIHAIYDTCASCESKNECVIPYCFNEKNGYVIVVLVMQLNIIIIVDMECIIWCCNIRIINFSIIF